MRNAPDTRASLLIRLRNPRDEQAWCDFLEIYEPAILEIARRRGLQAADAQDLLQDLLARVVKKMENWDHAPDKGSFRGWLATVARNLVIDHFRNQAKQPAALETTVIGACVAHQDEEACFDIAERRQLFKVAAQRCQPLFADSTWQAFWRTAVENQPVSEVAQALGLTSGAVYIARSRVMARIKSAIAALHFDSSVEEYRK
ncbi:MAG TPA: sigma-70 family RNA polymerase sigma factor [Pirellulaceae bacterium]|nr:sigma-70 family RNA polymerase sigma factor [Pirellulaceae bacterium]